MTHLTSPTLVIRSGVVRSGSAPQPSRSLSAAPAAQLSAQPVPAVRRRRLWRSGCWARNALIGLSLGLSLSAATLLATSSASAQSDGETEIARQRFLEGVRHYDKGDY